MKRFRAKAATLVGTSFQSFQSCVNLRVVSTRHMYLYIYMDFRSCWTADWHPDKTLAFITVAICM